MFAPLSRFKVAEAGEPGPKRLQELGSHAAAADTIRTAGSQPENAIHPACARPAPIPSPWQPFSPFMNLLAERPYVR